MGITTPVYALYTRRLRRRLRGGALPRHIGLIMDGNRRWARKAGLAGPSLGHKAGAEHVDDVLAWCESLAVRHVTVFVCSTENLARRGEDEVGFLMDLITRVVTERLARPGARWRLHVAGDLSVLPDRTAHALKEAVDAGREITTGNHVTLAIGYGGRQEVVDAVREVLTGHAEAGRSLAEAADAFEPDDIARHLWTAGHPDPDLVIRTSGEQRMSNFLLWQAAYAELYFCDAHWPAFREVDFLRALRSYAARERRRGR
ncbi:polyprenyl diphosphate synthase [Streptomyces sp. NPDC004031]